MGKNWTEICKFEEESVRWAFACLKLHSADGRAFQTAFPQCFTENDCGEIPLSIIVKKMRTLNDPDDWMIENALQALAVPYQRWATDERHYADNYEEVAGCVPRALVPTLTFGATAVIGGASVVVVESDIDSDNILGEIIMAPRERVLPDVTSLE